MVTELSPARLAHNELYSSQSFKNTEEKRRAQCQRNISKEKVQILASFPFFKYCFRPHDIISIFSLSSTWKTTLKCSMCQIGALIHNNAIILWPLWYYLWEAHVICMLPDASLNEGLDIIKSLPGIPCLTPLCFSLFHLSVKSSLHPSASYDIGPWMVHPSAGF